jgi:hypothetical protein
LSGIKYRYAYVYVSSMELLMFLLFYEKQISTFYSSCPNTKRGVLPN